MSGFDSGQVTFGDIPESVIDELITEHNVLNCSGALRAEHSAMQPYVVVSTLTDDIAGSLPVELTKRLIAQALASN